MPNREHNEFVCERLYLGYFREGAINTTTMKVFCSALLSLLVAAALTAASTTGYTRGATTSDNASSRSTPSSSADDYSSTAADCGVNCCPECDRVQRLPGYDAPLPSPWYSGYLTYELGNHTIHTHYVLVMAESVKDDGDDDDDGNDEQSSKKKPLIYWSNGGPGASSLFGLLTEVGPLWLNEDSFEKDSPLPKPQYNPYGWTRLGHIVMIDQPAPV